MKVLKSGSYLSLSKEAQSLKMKVLRRLHLSSIGRLGELSFIFERSAKLKDESLKASAFFIIERLEELSFILKGAGSLKMKALKRRRLSSTERLGECTPQEPAHAPGDPGAVRLDENDARQR